MKKIIVLLILPLFAINLAEAEEGGRKKEKSNHFLKLFDTNKDGIVTYDEFKTASELRYKAMDVNKDGIVSTEEFNKHAAKRHEQWEQKKRDRKESANDGEMTKQEYLDKAMRHAERKFSKLDKDQNGKLSEQEQAYEKHRKQRYMLEKMDENQDGQISTEEHRAMMQSWFDKLDTNKDTIISGDELNRRKHK
ncbi:MAG: EF-hand domain-containing protein [Methyloprofundus sp.]|nr:EF-hand domain-containing protein [Methyloprofundus sp.]MDT8424685.1 EF-hand domain-containing protein [Methyloprofundus sp.]